MEEKSDGEMSSKGSIRKWWRIILRVTVGLVILVVFAYLGISAFAATQLSKPVRNFAPELNPAAYDLVYEEVRYPARNDNLEIAAWYIPSEANEKVIILVHGRDNSRTNGFCDLFVEFARDLHQAGFSVMMIDLRGHGQSADSRYYFGLKEYQDVLGAVDWLETRGYQPGTIGVLGYSLGGGSVIFAAAEDEDIGAIWLDSAYADVESVIKQAWVSASGLPQVFFMSTKAMIRLFYGYDIAAARPIDQIQHVNPRPIYLAQCKEDPFVQMSHMDQLLATAQNAQTWVISNCDFTSSGVEVPENTVNNHAIGYVLQPELYTQKVVDFFSENLGN